MDWQGASSTLDRDLTYSIVRSSPTEGFIKPYPPYSADTFISGTHTIIYNLVDAAGNRAVPLVRRVTVSAGYIAGSETTLSPFGAAASPRIVLKTPQEAWCKAIAPTAGATNLLYSMRTSWVGHKNFDVAGATTQDTMGFEAGWQSGSQTAAREWATTRNAVLLMRPPTTTSTTSSTPTTSTTPRNGTSFAAPAPTTVRARAAPVVDLGRFYMSLQGGGQNAMRVLESLSATKTYRLTWWAQTTCVGAAQLQVRVDNVAVWSDNAALTSTWQSFEASFVPGNQEATLLLFNMNSLKNRCPINIDAVNVQLQSPTGVFNTMPAVLLNPSKQMRIHTPNVADPSASLLNRAGQSIIKHYNITLPSSEWRKSGFEMCFAPSTKGKGAGGKTHLKSRI